MRRLIFAARAYKDLAMKCLLTIICGGFCAAALWGQGGTVTSITAGSGLLGGTITTSGTLSLNLNSANTWTGAQSFGSNATFAANVSFPGGIWNSSGAVGIGTTSPTAKLYVNNLDNSVGAILATNAEGPGELRVHSYTTQPINVSSFGIVHAFYNDERNGSIQFWRGGSTSGGFLTFGTSGSERLRIDTSGNVGIGTTSPAHLLHVAGTIGAEEVIVSSSGADYVFDPGYRLAPLTEVAGYINEYRHLPDVPSAAEMQRNGASVGEMQARLLAKIEELTLHMIQAEERSHRLEQQNRDLQERLSRLESMNGQTNFDDPPPARSVSLANDSVSTYCVVPALR